MNTNKISGNMQRILEAKKPCQTYSGSALNA